MTFLEVFDVADPNECFRRAARVVPQQALALSNGALTTLPAAWFCATSAGLNARS